VSIFNFFKDLGPRAGSTGPRAWLTGPRPEFSKNEKVSNNFKSFLKIWVRELGPRAGSTRRKAVFLEAGPHADAQNTGFSLGYPYILLLLVGVDLSLRSPSWQIAGPHAHTQNIKFS
jgi:hypothetical protein